MFYFEKMIPQPVPALLVVGLLLLGSSVCAQTPWQSAPALPAQLPTPLSSTPAGSKVVSLAPPAAKSSPTQPPALGNNDIATPAYVALAKPGTAAFGGRDADQSNNSLVPSGFALPSQIPPQAAAASPSTAFPPLPSFQDLPLPSSAELPVNAPMTSPLQPLVGAREPSGRLVSFEAKPPTITTDDFKAGTLVAVVGSDRILAGDMAHIVEPIIELNRDKLRDESDEAKLRTQLTRQVLTQLVEIKALKQEFFRDMVGSGAPKELKTMTKTVTDKAGKIFFEKQVPSMQEKYDATDPAQLEMKLREKGMSLMTLRTQFIEQVLSQELERKYVPTEFEVSRDELLADYQSHRDDWDIPAKARWRQVTIRFDKHDNNRAVVDAMIKDLGNQIFLGGAPFEAVAKQSSEGYAAQDGGVYDWTTKGSLKSKPLDEAIFSLPPQQLSKVIVDDIGMHIVEVLEREEGHAEEFSVAQIKIRKRLSEEKREAALAKFRAKVLDRTPVWSLWPEDLQSKVKHVRPLSEAVGEDVTR